ncbi:MAG: hypothetical protein ACYTEQ_01680 [Planctomycetota bacterium]|jgi:hypothetical protein
MTKLNNPLTRETGATYRGRAIVVRLEPPNVILFKEKGRREWFEMDVETLYELAMIRKARENGGKK